MFWNVIVLYYLEISVRLGNIYVLHWQRTFCPWFDWIALWYSSNRCDLWLNMKDVVGISKGKSNPQNINNISEHIQSMGIFCAVHYFFQIEKNVLRCISSYANLNPSCVWRWLQLLSCGLHSFLLFCNFYLFIMSWQWSMICTMFLVTSSQSQLNSNYIWRRDN